MGSNCRTLRPLSPGGVVKLQRVRSPKTSREIPNMNPASVKSLFSLSARTLPPNPPDESECGSTWSKVRGPGVSPTVGRYAITSNGFVKRFENPAVPGTPISVTPTVDA